MHARRTVFRTAPENVETAAKIFREEVLPTARTIAGFKGGVALGDRTTGDCMSLTLWESEEAMNASAEAANRLRTWGLEKIGAQGPPEVHQYEVMVWEA